MVDIHCATAENRRAKKERKIEETTGQKYNVRICRSATQDGHKKLVKSRSIDAPCLLLKTPKLPLMQYHKSA